MRGIGYATEIDDGRRFLEEIEPDDVIVLLIRGDTESCCTAAVLTRTLRQMGNELVYPVFIEKGESAGEDSVTCRIASKSPSRLIIVGVCGLDRPPVPDLRTMVIDDHKPTGQMPVELFLTTYGADPPSPACLLAYEICKPLMFYDGTPWLSALGIAAHLGIHSEFEILKASVDQFGEHVIRGAVELLDAALSSSKQNVGLVYDVLMEADTPLDIVDMTVEGSGKLDEYRKEVQSEFRRVMQNELQMSGQWAIMKYSSPVMVERLVADAIAEDAPDKAAVAANFGYQDGHVSFEIAQIHAYQRESISEALGDTRCEESSRGAIFGIAPEASFESFLSKVGVERAERASA